MHICKESKRTKYRIQSILSSLLLFENISVIITYAKKNIVKKGD